ncbi:MAG: hypothetical protein JRD93_13310 [Deltaproteobacteria bacterium]|nr:hypothetical protein [Deltaproteobacteria bacterium]MBW2662934.1 hypothetical protein [Deltaproteobacteria bacterium]
MKLDSDNELLALSTFSADHKVLVIEVFEKMASEFLKPGFDALGGKISCYELNILRFCLTIYFFVLIFGLKNDISLNVQTWKGKE